MAYRIERIIPGGFHHYLMNLWEGNDLPSFSGSTKHAYLFDDKAVADRMIERLAARFPRTADLNLAPSQPITYEVVEVSKHAWGQYLVVSYERYHADFPNIVPAGRYDKLEDAKKHADSVTYRMVVIDSKDESRGFVFTNYSVGAITPEQCGASQLACNIINRTFLSLDGFAAMRKQMAGTTYTAEQFAGELTRIVDRELDQVTEFVAFAHDQLITNDGELSGADFIDACKDRLASMTIDPREAKHLRA